MLQSYEVVHPDQIIRLAAMECGASCLMTALGILGKEPGHFLLDYWNLHYETGALMGSREPDSIGLEQVYGLRLERREGNLQAIGEAVTDGGLAMVLCNPAKLEYFPRKFVPDEFGGDDHYVLIHGFNPIQRTFRIVDPIAHYIGEISWLELSLGVEREEAIEHEVILQADTDWIQMSPQELFVYAARRNADRLQSEETFLAVSAFMEDLDRIPGWEEEERGGWIYRNNLTLSTIVKLRASVWSSFTELGVMTADEMEEGQRQLKAIVKQWTVLTFQLAKLKKHGSEDQAASAYRHFSAILDAERMFLNWMEQIGALRGAQV